MQIGHQGKLALVTFEQRTAAADGGAHAEVDENGTGDHSSYDPQRRAVLLTRQLRLPMYLQDGLESSIEACAGKLDGETAERRIIEEMEEELGYRIAKVEKLFELYVSPGAVMEKIAFFTCAYSPADKVSAGGGLPEEGEDIEVIETTLKEAAAMISAGEIIDAKTVILVQYLRERVGD
jgi:nudix-type nucleoside diphosphatase (YffH/AdpP family)